MVNEIVWGQLIHDAKDAVDFVGRRQADSLAEGPGTVVALIQALIPLGLAAVHDALQREVEQLVGPRYGRDRGRPGHVHWSKERGSVYLLDQKLPITYQRVRGPTPRRRGALGHL